MISSYFKKLLEINQSKPDHSVDKVGWSDRKTIRVIHVQIKCGQSRLRDKSLDSYRPSLSTISIASHLDTSSDQTGTCWETQRAQGDIINNNKTFLPVRGLPLTHTALTTYNWYSLLQMLYLTIKCCKVPYTNALWTLTNNYWFFTNNCCKVFY